MPFVTAPNITPDRETGSGAWTDDMLARAIREGISHDGRALFPIMPYTQYRYLSDEDLASVVVYNITPDPSGIPYYDASLFLEVMRTGQAKARKIHDAMPWNAYGKQTDADLKAIFAYLQTVKRVRHRVDNTLPPTACPVCGGTHAGGDNQPRAAIARGWVGAPGTWGDHPMSPLR